jgi:MoxR-like ATPase
VHATRESPQLSVGASPRGSLALMKLGRARAALHGRDFVKPDDVKQVAVPALAHRLTLSPELWVKRTDPAELVASIVATVAAPVADEIEP